MHSDTRYADPSSEHKTYGFFSYKDDQVINKEGYKNRSFTAPVIPASEIRGMLRSAFEAVTNSCLSTTDNELLLSKRSSAPLNEYGLLVYEDKEWALFSAEYHKVYESHLGPKFHVHQNKVVWFKEGDSKPLSFEQRPGYREGVLHLTPLGVRSNSQRVFFNLNRKLKGEASDLARAYERTLAKYIDNAHEKACTYYKPLYDKLFKSKGKCDLVCLVYTIQI